MKTFDQLVEESKTRDVMDEIRQARTKMQSGIMPYTVRTVVAVPMTFEDHIKASPDYHNLLVQHGERLFIKRDGQYEIQSMRIAHYIWMNK